MNWFDPQLNSEPLTSEQCNNLIDQRSNLINSAIDPVPENYMDGVREYLNSKIGKKLFYYRVGQDSNYLSVWEDEANDLCEMYEFSRFEEFDGRQVPLLFEATLN
jgi:hypothetical protein